MNQPYAVVVAALQHGELTRYPEALEATWLYMEVRKVRNFKSWFRYDLTVGKSMSGFEQLRVKPSPKAHAFVKGMPERY
ncbi:hypothetical protein ACRS8P_00865 [Burkholderia cenocepacia]